MNRMRSLLGLAYLIAVVLFLQKSTPRLLANAAPSSSSAQKRAVAERQHPNIILITLDTTRADRMGFLGSRRGLTPHLDALAQQAVVFTRAYAQAPLTSVSHATILTGTYPQFHGVIDFPMPLAADLPYAPSILKANGYLTAAFLASLALDPAGGAPGFDRGFDVYDAHFRPQDLHKAGRYQSIERRGEEVLAHTTAWLDKQQSGPFFLWMHLYDAHDPYDPPEPYKSRYAAQPYDGEIAYDDMVVGKLLEHLKALKLYDGALIAITADHGESLGAHGEDTHGVFLYDETIHVPLVVKLPNGAASQRVDSKVELVDLLPTFLQEAGIARPHQMQGRSLFELIASPTVDKGDRPWPDSAYAQADYANIAYGWAKMQAWRTGKYLYIQAPHRELYDETNDAMAEHNFAAAAPAVADTLAGKMNEFRRTTSATRQAEGLQPDLAREKQLAALGYVAGVADGSEADPSEEDVDPKDRIQTVNLTGKLRQLIESEQYQDAIPVLQDLIVKNPDQSMLYFKLGGCYLELKQFEKAIPALRKAAELDPTFVTAQLNLGRALMATENYKASAAVFESLSNKYPKLMEAKLLLEISYQKWGRFPEAIQECKKVLHQQPEQYDTYLVLGQSLAATGELDQAESTFEKAIALRPRDPQPHLQLSYVYDRLGRSLDAARERQEWADLKSAEGRPNASQ
jgi:arylsulfatase A-like enzyme/Tfp pilus assembly protein PilF